MQAQLTLALTIVNGVGIITTQLPGGYIGQPYSLQCQASGGYPPYTWDNTDSNGNVVPLPPGLSISTSGLISGTPTAAFSGNVTIKAKDING